MRTRTSTSRIRNLPTSAQIEARLPLIRRIAFEVHERVRATRRLTRQIKSLQESDESKTKLHEAEKAVGEEQTAYLSCLVELADLGCELEHESPITIHARATVHGEPATLCWVIGECRIAWYHLDGASPGTARQPLD